MYDKKLLTDILWVIAEDGTITSYPAVSQITHLDYFKQIFQSLQLEMKVTTDIACAIKLAEENFCVFTASGKKMDGMFYGYLTMPSKRTEKQLATLEKLKPLFKTYYNDLLFDTNIAEKPKHYNAMYRTLSIEKIITNQKQIDNIDYLYHVLENEKIQEKTK